MQEVAVGEGVLAALLAVDEKLCALERRGGERLAVELDGDDAAQIRHAQVAVGAGRDGGERLHQREKGRRRAFAMDDESCHERAPSCPQ